MYRMSYDHIHPHYILVILTYSSQPTFTNPSPHYPPLGEREAALYYCTLGHLVASGLSTFCLTEAQPGTPGKGKGYNGRQQS